MIRLAGLEPGRDVELRDRRSTTGEKIDEELSFHHEIQERTSHVKITCVRGDGVEPVRLLARSSTHRPRPAHGLRPASARTEILVPESRNTSTSMNPPSPLGVSDETTTGRALLSGGEPVERRAVLEDEILTSEEAAAAEDRAHEAVGSDEEEHDSCVPGRRGKDLGLRYKALRAAALARQQPDLKPRPARRGAST